MVNGYGSVDLLVYLGSTRRELGDSPGAIEVLREAVEREPDNFGAWYTLAESYYNTGEDQYKDEAHWAMDHALELDPENPDAHWLMSMVRYHMFDNPEEAAQDLTRAIELRPDDAFFYNMRGVIYLETGQWEKCIKDYDVFADREPENPYAYYERAECYLGLDEIELARADYERFLDISGADPEFADMRVTAQDWLESN
jgi:tetratricopeptide (TPR) repeat protein